MVTAPVVIPPVTTTVVGGIVVLHVLHVDTKRRGCVVLYTARLCSLTFHCFLGFAAGIVKHLVLVLNSLPLGWPSTVLLQTDFWWKLVL